MAVTERYYVLLQNPITMDFWQLLTSYTRGRTSLAECLKFDGTQKSRIILVPRPDKGAAGSEVGCVGVRLCMCSQVAQLGILLFVCLSTCGDASP